MNILILGSEGFIGRHLVKHFSGIGADVTGCDLFEAPSQRYRYIKVSRLAPEYEELFMQQSYDACINAAGSGNVSYSMTHPLSDFEANALDTVRVLDNIRRHQSVCKYLHISSAAVYGNPVRLPIAETDALQPVSAYGWHKLIAEQVCKEFYQLYNIPVAAIRPFSVYGPGLQKQLLWDIYQKFVQNNNSIELWGTGMESRDFIFISDLAASVEVILNKSPMDGTVYNLASGKETTVSTLASLLLSQFSDTVAIQFNGKTRAGDPLNWRADISRLQSLGFTPGINIEAGLQATAAWMKSLH